MACIISVPKKFISKHFNFLSITQNHSISPIISCTLPKLVLLKFSLLRSYFSTRYKLKKIALQPSWLPVLPILWSSSVLIFTELLIFISSHSMSQLIFRSISVFHLIPYHWAFFVKANRKLLLWVIENYFYFMGANRWNRKDFFFHLKDKVYFSYFKEFCKTSIM